MVTVVDPSPSVYLTESSSAAKDTLRDMFSDSSSSIRASSTADRTVQRWAPTVCPEMNVREAGVGPR